jgi:hypothetical protein
MVTPNESSVAAEGLGVELETGFGDGFGAGVEPGVADCGELGDSLEPGEAPVPDGISLLPGAVPVPGLAQPRAAIRAGIVTTRVSFAIHTSGWLSVSTTAPCPVGGPWVGSAIASTYDP